MIAILKKLKFAKKLIKIITCIIPTFIKITKTIILVINPANSIFLSIVVLALMLLYYYILYKYSNTTILKSKKKL